MISWRCTSTSRTTAVWPMVCRQRHRCTLTKMPSRSILPSARRHITRLNNPAPGQSAHNATDAALVAIDPATGQVRAMLGSVDYFDEKIDGAVNLALAPRQPGSALKPLTYSLAFDPTRPDPWSPSTMILDVSTP